VSGPGRDGARPAPSRFLGVDLAWGCGNSSGVVVLAGRTFPLRLSGGPGVVSSHAAALAWIAAEADGHPAAVGIDAPLLGLGGLRRRRPCDDHVSRAFGRFHASTHSPPLAPDLRRFAVRLRRRYGARCLAPDVPPGRGRPAIREVYPHALQVRLFGLDRRRAVSRDEVLENCRVIAHATDLPVTADLENGYAHAPRAAAEMIRLAAEAGVVGGSMEDATGDPEHPIYDFDAAVERVHAAVEVARALPIPFMLTARAENLLHGRVDLDDTIRRLQAFERVGADVLYAPGLRDLVSIRTVVASVTRPVNVVATTLDPSITVAELAEAGVKRISVGGSLSRLALAAFLQGAREMKDAGGFT
jgi:2-methylisocitrate lyase-like PEP mutase family enzyme